VVYRSIRLGVCCLGRVREYNLQVVVIVGLLLVVLMINPTLLMVMVEHCCLY
jgi:hypothetical protein